MYKKLTVYMRKDTRKRHSQQRHFWFLRGKKRGCEGDISSQFGCTVILFLHCFAYETLQKCLSKKTKKTNKKTLWKNTVDTIENTSSLSLTVGPPKKADPPLKELWQLLSKWILY